MLFYIVLYNITFYCNVCYNESRKFNLIIDDSYNQVKLFFFFYLNFNKTNKTNKTNKQLIIRKTIFFQRIVQPFV